MKLATDGAALLLDDGLASLTATYAEGGRGPGLLVLLLTTESTGESQSAEVRLDPFSRDAYDVYEWTACAALVISGAQRIVFYQRDPLQLLTSICFEYEEVDGMDRPWFVETEDARALLVATETRVWCFDQRRAIRWCWSTRTRADACTISAPPQVNSELVRLSLESIHGEATVALSLMDAVEQVE